MTPSDKGWSVWICPRCSRRIPWRVIECRCGGFRAEAAGIIEAPVQRPPVPWLGVTVAIVALISAGVISWKVVPNRGERRNTKRLSRTLRPELPREELAEPAPLRAVDVAPSAPPTPSRDAFLQSAPGPTPNWDADQSSDEGQRTVGRAEGNRESGSSTPQRSQPSEADRARQRGLALLEQAYQAIGSRARGFLQRVVQYESRCGSARSGPSCSEEQTNLAREAIILANALDRAEDIGRMSWLEPGVVRDLRAKNGLDDEFWDKLMRATVQYR